jgi:hypothetical protein
MAAEVTMRFRLLQGSLIFRRAGNEQCLPCDENVIRLAHSGAPVKIPNLENDRRARRDRSCERPHESSEDAG